MNNETINNQLHDLLDGRVEEGELRSALENLSNNENATHSWRNYNLIGDVIRGEVSETGNCLISKISDALDEEPTILAPVRSTRIAASDSESNVIGLQGLNPSEPAKNDTLKAAGMFAIAASVALFAVLGISPVPVEQTNNTVVATATAPASELQQSSTQSFEEEFGQMLVTHGEFTTTAGLNGLASYAKLVSNESLGQ